MLFPNPDVARMDTGKEPKAIEVNEVVVVEDAFTEVATEDPFLAPVVIILGTPSSLTSRAPPTIDP